MDKAKTAAKGKGASGKPVVRRKESRASLKDGPNAAAQTKDSVSVTDAALATLIGLAAHEVPGVVGMAPAGIREGIKRVLGVAQADEGVVISHDGAATNVDLHVVVAYGVNIPVVADSVRERVSYAARAFAGVELDEVRVYVDGVSRG